MQHCLQFDIITVILNNQVVLHHQNVFSTQNQQKICFTLLTFKYDAIMAKEVTKKLKIHLGYVVIIEF